MIDGVQHLDDIGQDIERLRGLIQRALKEDVDPGVREQLEELHGALAHNFDQIKETLPAAQKQMQDDIAALQQAEKTSRQEIEELTKVLQQQAEAVAAAVPDLPVIIPFDPRLGLQLRDELLKRYAPAQPAHQPVRAGEVASMSSAEFDTAEDEAKPAHKPKPAPSPKAKPRSDDWSIDS
ncbi:MAG: hypothetical protein AB7K24_16265 [Gemmataceae bacterium]